MIYSMVRFRKSKGAVADPTFLHSTRSRSSGPRAGADPDQHGGAGRDGAGADRRSARPRLTIRVTGYQWKWAYEYVGTGVTVCRRLDRAQQSRAPARLRHRSVTTVPNYLLDVDHPLVVPAGVKVRLLITGQDVIHSWWVPALGDQEGCDSRASSTRPGSISTPTRPACTAANAPNCAAAIMASCRSCSRSRARRISEMAEDQQAATSRRRTRAGRRPPAPPASRSHRSAAPRSSTE